MSTAVILAARQERDSDVPYPLMPFEEGKCLIDRTLEILRGSGYRKILIVAGFRFEMFKRFSENGVTVVPAPDYRHTASMASLATVRNLVDEDFLLIEGDTFYERKVVEKLTASSHRNCLATTEESGSGDEAFTESSQGFITKVSKDRHQICQFEGELLGICKISHDTYQKMLLRWDEGNNPLVNYEYLLMDCTSVLERPFIHFKNLIWGDVDNRSNYERLVNYTYPRLRRKEDPFDRENLLNHLRDIFGSRLRDDEVAVEQIGGMSNKNFKVRLNGESYVLRVPGIASEGMVDRSVEGRNSQFASRIGINPEVRYFNDQTGVKLTDYICGAETLNGATIQRKDNLQKIAAIYRTLHMSKVRFNNDFNVFREIGKYEGLLQQCGAVMYSGYDTVRDELPLLEARLNELGVSLAPCHNDESQQRRTQVQRPQPRHSHPYHRLYLRSRLRRSKAAHPLYHRLRALAHHLHQSLAGCQQDRAQARRTEPPVHARLHLPHLPPFLRKLSLRRAHSEYQQMHPVWCRTHQIKINSN